MSPGVARESSRDLLGDGSTAGYSDIFGSWPKSATEVEGFWIQQVGGAAAGVNPRSI
jgi:hypothetical protein